MHAVARHSIQETPWRGAVLVLVTVISFNHGSSLTAASFSSLISLALSLSRFQKIHLASIRRARCQETRRSVPFQNSSRGETRPVQLFFVSLAL